MFDQLSIHFWFNLPAGRTGFGSLLSLGHSSARTDRIFMRGPGGRGEVEVAVSGVLGESTNAIPLPSYLKPQN